MSATQPRVNETFQAKTNAQERVVIVEAGTDEVRYRRRDGSTGRVPRASFLNNYRYADSPRSVQR